MGNTVSNVTKFSYGETTCSNPTLTITNSLTEHPPSSYSVKIENLTQLSNESYQSRRFTAGGYDWRLIIYPKGNDEDKGSGFISMYVEIDSTSEVFAYLKFFLYNKKENKYLTIQDTEVKRFNALRRVWGLSRVLPLYFFNYPENGYIFEGHKCEFGVDVMVVPPLTNWEVLSFNEKPSNPKFSWSVKDFSKLKGNRCESNKFSTGGRKCVLSLYSKGKAKADSKWFSVFLHMADNETLLEDEKIYVHADYRVLDPRGSNHFTHPLKKWCKHSGHGRGWEQFMTIAKLREAYLLDKEDTLTVEVEFKVVSTTKYSLPLPSHSVSSYN